jgi:hypothetical protein
MSLTKTWREVALANATGAQKEMVDYVTEDAPIFESTPMEETSDGFQDVFEVLTSTDYIPEQELDAPLQSVDISSKLDQTNLRNWAAKMEVGEDKLATMKLSKEQYFAKKSPKILMETGAKLSLTTYNAFKNYAIDNQVNGGIADRVIDGTGSNNTNYSIAAVKYVKSEITGLYSSQAWGNGKVVDVMNISGGNAYLNTDGVLVYGTRMKLNSGLKLANPRYVTSIVNIDKDPASFTTINLDDKISQIIEEARGADVLYMHPTLKRLIGSVFKIEKIQLQNSDREVNSLIDAWDEVPIITDYNLLKGTETNVTL